MDIPIKEPGRYFFLVVPITSLFVSWLCWILAIQCINVKALYWSTTSETEGSYPNAEALWCWQYVFPATRRFVDSVTGTEGRHHLHQSVL